MNDDILHLTATDVTKPLPIFSHATSFDGLIHLSCVQGFVPGTFDYPGPDAHTQALQIMKNLTTILLQANSDLSRVLKLTILFVDLKEDFESVNQVINQFFPKNPPARSSIGVAELPRAARVVVECTAAAQ